MIFRKLFEPVISQRRALWNPCKGNMHWAPPVMSNCSLHNSRHNRIEST